MKEKFILIMQYGLIALAAVVVFGAVSLLSPSTSVHALPEFAARTGEGCGTCHVSPGGGGPRTLRGMLWAARGKPDAVPQLPNVLLAPGVEDGAELYDIACAACHGAKGEGLFGAQLASTSLKPSKIKSTINRGRERSGMPPFDGQFSDTQLDALVNYVAGLASGAVQSPPDSYPLESGVLKCTTNSTLVTCGGN